MNNTKIEWGETYRIQEFPVIRVGMEDRDEGSDRDGRRRPSPEVTASSGDE